MSARLVLLVGAALVCGGCEVSSEIGKPCVLVRKSTPEELAKDGIATRPIMEAELRPGQDFISFGSVQCEDLICVRDASYARTSEDGSALGYCSKACVAEVPATCAVGEDVEEDLKKRMSCRALLLDQQALDDLRRDDPATYRATFGDNTSPFFCAAAPVVSQN